MSVSDGDSTFNTSHNESFHTDFSRGQSGANSTLQKIVKKRPLTFYHKPCTYLSVISIAFGALCVIMEVIIMSLQPLWVSGAGIWCGVFFIAAGASGMYAARNKHRRSIKIFMVLSFVAIIFGMVLIGMGIQGYREHFTCTRSYTDAGENLNICGYRHAVYLLNIFLVTIAVLEIFIMIATAAICCKAIFGREKQRGMIYVPGHNAAGEPVMIAVPPR